MTPKRWAVAALLSLAAIVLAALAWWRQWLPDTYDYQAAFEAPPQGDAQALIPVAAIVGKSQQALREQLGEPSTCERAEFSTRCRYAQNDLQITFIDDKADWLTVSLRDRGLPLSAATLAVLGLPVREPDEVTEHESIWRHHAGYRELRLVGGTEGASYARIKYATP